MTGICTPFVSVIELVGYVGTQRKFIAMHGSTTGDFKVAYFLKRHEDVTVRFIVQFIIYTAWFQSVCIRKETLFSVYMAYIQTSCETLPDVSGINMNILFFAGRVPQPVFVETCPVGVYVDAVGRYTKVGIIDKSTPQF